MQNKEHSLCFTGHRGEKLPKAEKEMEQLRNSLLREIDKAMENGIDTFYMGACYGFDLLAAEMVLLRKKVIPLNEPNRKRIKLIAVVPHEGQANAWDEQDRERYFDYTLPFCDDVITLHTQFQPGCYHERNRYMVDRCCQMIAYYDGGKGGTAYTIKYAQSKKLNIINLYEQKI